MAARAKKGSALPVSTGLAGNDYVIAIANVASVVNNAIVTATNFFANTNVPHVTVGNNAMSTANLVVRSVPAGIPGSSGANGAIGQIKWDANFLYVCVGTNSWKRTTLVSF